MIFKKMLEFLEICTAFRLITFICLIFLLSFNAFGLCSIYLNGTPNNNSTITSDNNSTTINLEDINNKEEIINQITQLIALIITIIVSLVVAIFQILNPKYYQILKNILLRKENIFLFSLSLAIVFLTISYNFFNKLNNTILTVEFVFLILSIGFLTILIYKLAKYSSKSTLIFSYLNSLGNLDIFKEVCDKYGYPKEEKGRCEVILKSSEDKEDMGISIIEKEDYEKNREIKQLSREIKENKNESDLESVFDILNLAIEDSEYKFFLKSLDRLNDKIFSTINDNDLNYDIKNNVLYLLFSCYDRLVKTSIKKERFEFYALILESYEKLGKVLIDLENFTSVKELVDQIEKHSHDLNQKIFHIDYSYKGTDCIFHLINYYINKDSYEEFEVQKWLEVAGSIAEDITEVDYRIKYNTIRTDYTSRTKLEYNPVIKIITDLENLDNQVIKKLTKINDMAKNGECVIETISLILKSITIKLIEIGDFTTTYDIYIAYEKIAEDAINEELHYSLNYIIQDLHKIGHEIIKKKWFNNANSLLFYIAKLGVLAENKKIVKPYSFHSFESKD